MNFKINNDSYIIRNESLPVEAISALISSTTDIFPEYLDPNILYDYSIKLSQYAQFVTIRKVDDEALVSVIAYYSNRPPVCYISFVCVLPEFRRKGLSQIMLLFLENHAKEMDLSLIKLEVRMNNISAVNAYNKSGYSISEIASPNSYFMCKHLV